MDHRNEIHRIRMTCRPHFWKLWHELFKIIFHSILSQQVYVVLITYMSLLSMQSHDLKYCLICCRMLLIFLLPIQNAHCNWTGNSLFCISILCLSYFLLSVTTLPSSHTSDTSFLYLLHLSKYFKIWYKHMSLKTTTTWYPVI
jgi:hypothetical protein